MTTSKNKGREGADVGEGSAPVVPACKLRAQRTRHVKQGHPRRRLTKKQKQRAIYWGAASVGVVALSLAVAMMIRFSARFSGIPDPEGPGPELVKAEIEKQRTSAMLADEHRRRLEQEVAALKGTNAHLKEVRIGESSQAEGLKAEELQRALEVARRESADLGRDKERMAAKLEDAEKSLGSLEDQRKQLELRVQELDRRLAQARPKGEEVVGAPRPSVASEPVGGAPGPSVSRPPVVSVATPATVADLGCRQALVGLADSWTSNEVALRRWESEGDAWRAVDSAAWIARSGRNGLGWGVGVHESLAKARGIMGGWEKQEGDRRSPCGVFDLGPVCGYDPEPQRHPKIEYIQVGARDLWISDPDSEEYNTHRRVAGDQPLSEWEQKQQMTFDDPCHRLKVFVRHNAPPKVSRGAGSAVFLFIWRDNGRLPTTGSIGMPEERVRELVAWLDPEKRPLLVLLPKEVYKVAKGLWGLP